MRYRVEYVELPNGKHPFEEFTQSLPINERARELRDMYEQGY